MKRRKLCHEIIMHCLFRGVIVLVCAVLGGCGSFGGGSVSDCPKAQGYACKSLTEVDEKSLSLNDSGLSEHGKHSLLMKEFSGKAIASARSQEQIKTVWLAPYVDANERYFHDARVEIVVQPSLWQRLEKSEKGRE